ncbi:MAG TPA: hypothetical protein VI916_13900 [Acidimicrobiia bacterium]|nr:hypothetical protein [Acidimicrobiia bacterium]
MASVAPAQQRRALVIAAGGFVLVLALFVGSRLVGGGGGSETAEPSAPSTPAPKTTPGTPPPGGGASGPAEVPVVAIPPVPEAFETSELRDPFTPPLAAIEFLRALLPPSSGDPSPDDPSPSPASVALRSITVVDGAEVATLDVGGTLYDAAEGDRFGPNDEYRVVTLDAGAQCGTFLFGDEAFSMCVGQAPQQPPAPGTTPQK